MAAENWRDQHREPAGTFRPRPNAKGFKDSPQKSPLAAWVEKNKRGKKAGK